MIRNKNHRSRVHGPGKWVWLVPARKRLGFVQLATSCRRDNASDSTEPTQVSCGISAVPNNDMLYIEFFGQCKIFVDEQPLPPIRSIRRQSLLAYLVLHAGRSLSRQQLAVTFWPDTSDGQARTNLRQLLFHLKHDLPDTKEYIAVDRLSVMWRTDIPVQADVLCFEELIERDTRMSLPPPWASGSGQKHLDRLKQALTLYRGEFLPGCYDDWVLARRDLLHQRYRDTLADAAICSVADQDYNAALNYGRQLVAADRLDEASYALLMHCLLSANRPSEALRVYEQCTDMLAAELGVEPGSQTVELRDACRAAMQSPIRVGERPGPVQVNGDVYAPAPIAPMSTIGRDAAWSALTQSVQDVQQMGIQLAILYGEPGIGKTHMLNALAEWARRAGWTVSSARCQMLEGNLLYAPVVEWLSSTTLLPICESMDSVWRDELAWLIPGLQRAVQDRSAGRSAHRAGDAWQRTRLFAALARVIRLGSGAFAARYRRSSVV